MIDFHTHILPGIDDGSKDVRQSLEMLRMEQKMGIDTIFLTPHFYASQNSPEIFLDRREEAWQKLQTGMEEGLPQLFLGAEVQYFESIGYAQNLSSLCIQGTNLLLLEMPFNRWDERMVRTVLDLNGMDGVQIVLAHIDRYLKFVKEDVWDLFQRSGILMQLNASAFSGLLHRRKAVSLMQNGTVQFLGSDCHNLDSRKPNWELVPERAWQIAEQNCDYLLRQITAFL